MQDRRRARGNDGHATRIGVPRPVKAGKLILKPEISTGHQQHARHAYDLGYAQIGGFFISGFVE